MGKFLKKNWFVMLVVAIFLAISVYYIYDTNKGKLKGKQTNGEDVVYSIDDNDTTASEFYETLFRTNGSNAQLTLFKRAVADASISTTNEIKDAAAKQAESIIANYKNSYGANYEAKLEEVAGDNPYLTLVQNYDTTLSNQALWAKAEELGIDFKGNTELENSIKKAMGINTESEETK